MRFLVLLGLMLSWSAPAFACLGPSSETTLFFKQVPEGLHADFIGKVVVDYVDSSDPVIAVARIVSVIQGGGYQPARKCNFDSGYRAAGRTSGSATRALSSQ
jgi:hypothetical protein